VRDVVIVPGAEEDAGSGGSPAHHEGCEIGDVELGGDVDGDVDEEADEGEEETEGDEGTTSSCVIGGEGEDQEHGGARDVGGDGVEIGFDGGVAETGDDLGEEEVDALEGDAETDFDGEEGVCGGLFEDGEGVVEVEFFVDDGGGVDLNAVVGEVAFGFGEEFGG